jgi:hypothetical protein
MDNETESQELDRAYREYSEVQQKLEQAAQAEVMRVAAQAERTLAAFNHFLTKVL